MYRFFTVDNCIDGKVINFNCFKFTNYLWVYYTLLLSPPQEKMKKMSDVGTLREVFGTTQSKKNRKKCQQGLQKCGIHKKDLFYIIDQFFMNLLFFHFKKYWGRGGEILELYVMICKKSLKKKKNFLEPNCSAGSNCEFKPSRDLLKHTQKVSSKSV